MTIQIEEGRFYRNREGTVEGPMHRRASQTFGFEWTEDAHGRTWKGDGHFLQSIDHPLDLVARVTVEGVIRTFEGPQVAETPEWAAAVEAEVKEDRLYAAAAKAGPLFSHGPDDIKATIADEAKRIVSGARRSAYGKPEDNFERIARLWQAHFANTGRPEANVTANDISLLMVLMKIGRLAESPQHYDSWVDVVGYALTGAEVNGVKKAA